MHTKIATGQVVQAFGNLLHVEFDGDIRQGEMALVHIRGLTLKAEVLEIRGVIAKIQVFEDTRGIELGTQIEFSRHLLEAELGPGLLASIFDGLQNPLEEVANAAGLFLTRGLYLPAIDRQRHWDYHPSATVGQVVRRGDLLGHVMEGRFHHNIAVPFAMFDEYTLTWVAKPGAYSVAAVIAKGVDTHDKELEFTMLQKWPIKAPLLVGKRCPAHEVMSTGLRILDTQFPLVKGGTFCSPGPFGAGKTVLQHHLSKYSDVDIVVVVACGERAGEVVEMLRTFPQLADVHSGESLMTRTVIICNTSSMPVAAREASVYMGATIAEYYRQMGLDVLLLADSTSRWAQAMREMSGRLEEIPGEEAFPAYLASRIAAFYERGGAIELPNGHIGTLTIGGTVSPAGGNFEEPVTQATLVSVGAFLGLSRARSNARRYPAIDPLISWSKYVDVVAESMATRMPAWRHFVERATVLLREGDDIGKRMEVVGQEGIAMEDLLVYLQAELYEFCYLQQNAFDKEDAYCPLERQMDLVAIIAKIFDGEFVFANLDVARAFFIELQNELKNMNFLPYHSHPYDTLYAQLTDKIPSTSKARG